MSHDPLVVVLQVQPVIETNALAIERPAPSLAQQQISDDVFTRDQSQAIATLLSVQTGLAFVQHLVAETFPPKQTVEVPPRRKPDEKPDE